MERYSQSRNENQQWFDYEYKGFHLVLNLEEVQNFEYSELIHVMEKMVKRIQMQQQLTNSQGIAKLKVEDEVDSSAH